MVSCAFLTFFLLSILKSRLKDSAKTVNASLSCLTTAIIYFVVLSRSRLVGIHRGTLDQQRGTLGAVRGMGETSLEIKQRLIKVEFTIFLEILVFLPISKRVICTMYSFYSNKR